MISVEAIHGTWEPTGGFACRSEHRSLVKLADFCRPAEPLGVGAAFAIIFARQDRTPSLEALLIAGRYIPRAWAIAQISDMVR